MMKEKIEKNKRKLIGYLILGIIGICIVIGAFSIFMEADKIKGNGLNWHTGVTYKEEREDEQKWGCIVFLVGAVLIAESGSKCYRILFKDNAENQKKNKNDKIDTTGKLRELKKMLDEKIITEEEFENKKQELLKKM